MHLDLPLLGVIPESREVAHAVYTHKNAADCNEDGAGDALCRIVSRLLGEDVPLPRFRLSWRGKMRLKKRDRL